MRYCFFGVLLFLFPATINAQDTIELRSGERIAAIVQLVNDDEIRFRPYGETEGTTLAFYIADVRRIRYADGREVFPNGDIGAPVESMTEDNQMSKLGQEDAQKYYKGKKSGYKTVGTITILLTPVAGVIPAILCASSVPKHKNLNYPDETLMENPVYKKAYREQAHKFKKRQIWTTFGVSSAAFLILVLLI